MSALNVLGTALQACSYDPLTGYYRDGCCNTDAQDHGTHVVCAKVTADFLAYSLQRGNDLVTPQPEYRFVGLRPGDRWCLCINRWVEALHAGVAPPVYLEATHPKALERVSLEQLKEYALPLPWCTSRSMMATCRGGAPGRAVRPHSACTVGSARPWLRSRESRFHGTPQQAGCHGLCP